MTRTRENLWFSALFGLFTMWSGLTTGMLFTDGEYLLAALVGGWGLVMVVLCVVAAFDAGKWSHDEIEGD